MEAHTLELGGQKIDLRNVKAIQPLTGRTRLYFKNGKPPLYVTTAEGSQLWDALKQCADAELEANPDAEFEFPAITA